ncbi:unnamed protein product [Peronospora belbahrii]|uniref:V-type proton ATPase subunit S1/VOA1 transmembrane domain-containing protein n=1 Tax=Peronospora belbahrii TaxID=622444 RepID=A0AAU9L071_9STRA|nr:unnamed protein product [Peronospora belbahrii]CAH0515296.1 unnamed protein product [Peronospora belbahrii]
MTKTFLSSALCGLVAVLSNASATTLFPHVPIVMWSQRPIFAGSNTYVSLEMDEVALASTLETVLTRDITADSVGMLSTPTTSFQQAEIMCLFLLPSLVLEDVPHLSKGAGSFIQNVVHNSVSSVVIPHTTRTKFLLSELTSMKPHIVGLKKLDAFIVSEEIQMLLSNGKTDLIVVQLPETMPLSDVDAAVKTASSKLNEASDGKMDFAFTGNDATPVVIQDLFARRLNAQAKAKMNSTQAAAFECQEGYLIGYSAAGKAFCFSHYVNITPDIMTGLLVGLLFIFMAYIGLSVLHQIQTPQRYPVQGAPRGKEF